MPKQRTLIIILGLSAAVLGGVAWAILAGEGPATAPRDEPINCGVACVQFLMAMRAPQASVDHVPALARKYVSAKNTIDLASLKHLCSDLGFDAVLLHVELDDLRLINVPFILHTNVPKEGHFVVCTQVAEDRVQVVDPIAGGSKIYSMKFEVLRQRFSGYVLAFDTPGNGKVNR